VIANARQVYTQLKLSTDLLYSEQQIHTSIDSNKGMS